jgi:hypothetical protein
VANCADYPPEGIVTFYDIKIEYDNAPVQPVFTTGIVDDVRAMSRCDHAEQLNN